MTPEDLIAMRKSAALAFAVPGLEIDIHWGGQPDYPLLLSAE